MSDSEDKGTKAPDLSKGPILVPVDFSPFSEAALLFACDLARCTRSSVIVLHVVHDPSELPGYYAKLAKRKTLARMEDMAGEMLDEFMNKLKHDQPDVKELGKAEVKLVSGLPVTRILQVAEKTGATMLVMGSKGTTGLKHLLMGSVAEQVLHLADIPVAIVKAGAGKN